MGMGTRITNSGGASRVNGAGGLFIPNFHPHPHALTSVSDDGEKAVDPGNNP